MPAYKYTLKNGKTVKWYANFYYTDWKGQRKHVCKRGFSTQREAKAYERMFLNQVKGTGDLLFSELVSNYMEDMSHRLKVTTIANKQQIIVTKILPYFADKKIGEIDTIMIRRWQNELIAVRKRNGEGYSQTYLKTINNQLSALFNYAVKHYDLLNNPCKAAGTIGCSRAEEMQIWTQEEFEQVLSFEEKESYRLAYNVLFYSGIREGELLAITPADVLPTMQLNITKNFAVVQKEEIFLTPKTGRSRRKVAIPEFLYQELLRYMEKGEQRRNHRLFDLKKQQLLTELKKLAHRAGVVPIRVHDLRHSHASMLIDMGIELFEISRRLGHESVKTTSDIYGHLYPDKDMRIAARINNIKKKSHLG